MTTRLTMGLLALLLPGAAAAALPVEDFFRRPEFTEASLAPDGKHLAVTVPQDDRTLLAMLTVPELKLVGKWDYGKDNHVDEVIWVNDERFLMRVVEKTGSFDFMVGKGDLYASNIDGSKRIDIPNGAFFSVIDILRDDPRRIMVSRSIDNAFLFKLDVYSGKTSTVASAPLDMGGFAVDHDGRIRYAIGAMNNGTVLTLRRDGNAWTELVRDESGGGDAVFPLGFAEDNRRVYMAVAKQGKPQEVILRDPETGKQDQLSGNDNVVPSDYLWSSDGRTLIAVRYNDGFPAYDFVAREHPEAKLFAGLLQAFPEHAVEILDTSRDGRFVLFSTYSDVDPTTFYLFDRKNNQAKFLVEARSWIDPKQMAPMKPIAVTARDGIQLHGYLTVPRGSDGRNLPLVLNIHGGPHGPRDEWRFDPEVQFLANRGYAVLQMNYRGSGGYGHAFESMGYRKWGTTMQDDLTDAVNWAIAQGIADPDRVCTYGGSYGGYAALMSVVREPGLYRCAVGYVGVFSLPMMFRKGDIPESEFGRNYLDRVMPETLAEQQAQSPAYNAGRIKVPVMLIHGAKDRRVPLAQMEFLVEKMAEAGNKPELVVVEKKEGHGFQLPENNYRLYPQLEAFLDRHIGEKRSTASSQ